MKVEPTSNTKAGSTSSAKIVVPPIPKKLKKTKRGVRTK